MITRKRKHKYETWLEWPKPRKDKIEREEAKFEAEKKQRYKFDF